MRRTFIVLFLMGLIGACAGDDAAAPSPSATARPSRAEPTLAVLAPAPEGRLLISFTQSARIASLDAEGNLEDLARGWTWNGSLDHRSMAVTQTDEKQNAIGLATLTAAGIDTIVEFGVAGPEPQTVWSPDGSLLAYTSPAEAGVFVWDGSSSRRLLDAAGTWPSAWAGNGDLIIYDEIGPRLLWVGDDGAITGATELDTEYDPMGWEISPDGEKVALQTGRVENRDGFRYVEYTGLWIYDRTAGEWERVADLGGATVRRGAGLFVSADAAAAVRAAASVKGPPPVHWSPDGTRLTYFRVSSEDGYPASDLWVYDLATDKNELITSDGAYQDSWSPDARYLAFMLRDAQSVGVLGPDGVVTEVEGGSERTIGWTPAGELIISASSRISLYDPETGTLDIISETTDGSAVPGTQFNAGDARWSPSERYSAFAANHGATSSVYVLDIEGRTVTRILKDVPMCWVAGWIDEP